MLENEISLQGFRESGLDSKRNAYTVTDIITANKIMALHLMLFCIFLTLIFCTVPDVLKMRHDIHGIQDDYDIHLLL